MLTIKDPVKSYLAFSRYIDADAPSVQRKARVLAKSADGEMELAKATYHFVRDEIQHSWDLHDKMQTLETGTDALYMHLHVLPERHHPA